MLLADRLGALWADISVRDYGTLNVLTAWMGIAAFAFQLYFELSGYSDMAIGLGAVLGFRLPENFNYPYISQSVTEFWHRWHMTLGSWFREYVYIPLGGSQKGLGRQLLNILLVWTLMGMWYGAGVHFLLWGLWFALFLMLEKAFLKKVLDRLPGCLGLVYTLIVVGVGWVFFEIESMQGIREYLSALCGLNHAGWWNQETLFLGKEYLVWFVIAVLASLPFVKRFVGALETGKTGPAMAVYRLGEKVIVPMLLLLSIAYMVGGWL